MATRPRKKAKCEAPGLLTRKQIKKAAFESHLYVDVWDPFALLKLEAFKTNSNCTHLTIRVTMNEKVPRKFLGALAQFMVAHPCISRLMFHGVPFGPSVEADEAGDDYAALIVAMIGSQSLQEITIEKCLPLKLEEAIIEVLRQKSTSISLGLHDSMMFAVHPIAFGRMLATTKCLSHLALNGVKVVGDQPYEKSHFRDGLKKNQSLKGIRFWGEYEPEIFNDVLECTEGIESLTVFVQSRLDSTSAALLTKFISKHEKLEHLYVHITPDSPDTVEAVCEAVSCSRSLTELQIDPHSNVTAISRMLQQTTSLQKLRLDSSDGHNINFETLAVDLEACKTLVRFETEKSKLNVREAHALLKVVLTNHNLSEISIGGEWYHFYYGSVCQQKTTMSNLRMELLFYLSFNKRGRALLQEDVSLGVWPYALKKAGSSSLPDALYYFLQEMPELIKHHSSVH